MKLFLSSHSWFLPAACSWRLSGLIFLLLFFLLGGGGVDFVEGTEIAVPARRLVYRTDSWLIRGRAEVHYRYGKLNRVARQLPYDNTHQAARRQYRAAANRNVLTLSTSIQVRLMPDYYLESYLDPSSLRPLRAVRWKNNFPDILFDYIDEEQLLLTRAEPVSPGFFSRVGSFLQSAPNEPEFEFLGPYQPFETGGQLVDLITVFFQIEEKFTGKGGVPDKPFFLSAMRKDLKNIYVGRFDPVERMPISVEVNGVSIRRMAIRCEVTLQYGVLMVPRAEDTVASLAAEYMPDLLRSEAKEIVRGIFAGEILEKQLDRPMVMPVSMSVYNRIHEEDKDFRGPFGLSESVTLWVDERLGIPLRAECSIYGIGGAVLLTESDPQYFKRLTR